MSTGLSNINEDNALEMAAEGQVIASANTTNSVEHVDRDQATSTSTQDNTHHIKTLDTNRSTSGPLSDVPNSPEQHQKDLNKKDPTICKDIERNDDQEQKTGDNDQISKASARISPPSLGIEC
jgi:hypothetical protein